MRLVDDAFNISRILIQLRKITVFLLFTYSELSGTMSHVSRVLIYVLPSLKICLCLNYKLVLEIIR